VQLCVFWLVIIALVIFRMEGLKAMESKEVKGKGKNKLSSRNKKKKPKKQTKKFQRYKQGETVY
jgi:hypothetical protein